MQAMKSTVCHTGKVVSATGSEVWVEIVNQSACAHCRAKTLCSLSEQKEKQVSVPIKLGDCWSVGEEVEVSMRASLGYWAVFLMYVLPLIVLLIVLFSLNALGAPEWLTGLGALAAPLFCFGVVWLFRDRIGKQYTFVLQK